MNIFTKPLEHYKRNINPLIAYKKQVSFYISKTKNIPLDQSTQQVEQLIKDKKIQFNDTELICYHRKENGDKALESTTLINYIKDTVHNEYVLAPTFTNYVPESVRVSPLVTFTDKNVKNRSKAKQEGFKAKNEGDMVKFTFKNNEQNNLKVYNNSLSGAFATEGSVFKNPTAHSTLTSITRMETSLANALNEKIIAGNRHYRSLKITLNNINFLASITDKSVLQSIVAKYGLVLPTPDDVFNCIKESTDLYWYDSVASDKLKTYLNKLDGYELASVMYINDLYHIRQLNNTFIKNMVDIFTIKITDKNYDNPLELIKNIPEAVINYAHQICIDEVRGIGKDYAKLDKIKVCTLLATCQNIVQSLEYYKDFFQAFFVTDDIPCSTANIKSMIRKAVVLSDTDSTMFSCDEWITWYYNEFIFTEKGYAIAGFIGLIVSQAIVHVLAMYSANMGVSKDKLNKIQMKPEFVFPVFVQAPVSKHYFTCIMMQEGNVFSKLDYEIKGVHLKNSALPKEVIASSHDKMKEILHAIMDNKKLSLKTEINELIQLENKFRDDILYNREIYYRKTTIKEATSYKLEEDKCPYWHYKLWRNVFELDYGEITPPPYKALILPLTITNKTSMLLWMSKIENQELATRLTEFLKVSGKDTLMTMYIPEDYIRAFGIPKEILLVLDIKRIVLDLTLSRRIIIDALGLTPKTGMLFSEYLVST